MADTKIELLYLNEDDMRKAGVLDAGRCVDTIEEVISLLGTGDYLMGGKNGNNHGIQLMFPKRSKFENFPLEDSRDRRFMAMPAYLGGRFHMAGEKWYGSNGRNTKKGLPRSILMVTLNDVETGQPLAYMSGNLLSAMRTGAVPGVVAKHLARKDSKVIALIGAGVMNRTCLMAYLSKFPNIETVKIKGGSAASKSALGMADFIKKEYPSVKNIMICKTLEEAVTDADIISEAVSVPLFQWPEFDPAWLKPGCVFISSGTLEMDHDFMRDHMSKVVDNRLMYQEYLEVYEEYDENGNRRSFGVPGMFFEEMVEAGMDEKEIRELGDIVNGKVPGRTSEDEMFMVSVGGMPILDVGWGHDCYQEALKNGIGTKLKLWDEPFLR